MIHEVEIDAETPQSGSGSGHWMIRAESGVEFVR